MLDELDFTKEAQNLINFRAFLEMKQIVDATAPMYGTHLQYTHSIYSTTRCQPKLPIPTDRPYLGASSKRVLTMEYLRGAPLVDLEGIKRYSSNPEATLITALKTWALSVATNDVFHADVHGGNLLVSRLLLM